jgi:hypothetical protein
MRRYKIFLRWSLGKCTSFTFNGVGLIKTAEEVTMDYMSWPHIILWRLGTKDIQGEWNRAGSSEICATAQAVTNIIAAVERKTVASLYTVAICVIITTRLKRPLIWIDGGNKCCRIL